jgi:PhoD-like phosphatase
VQPGWLEIREAQPDVLLLLGDNVYLDRDQHVAPDALAAELRSLYALQFAQPEFAALISDMKQRNGRIVAIYDDHDFLGNNRYGGDNAPALCEAARAEFVRAFAPQRSGDDVYAVYRLGLVDLIMVDTRFYRRSPTNSKHDRDAVLGARQWAWLEEVVAASTAPYLMLASSATVHTFADESWEQYPAAFQRIVSLLIKRNGAFAVTGDVHRNETYDDSGLIEIVTSAVARPSLLRGAERRNWGLFTFTNAAMRVQLFSLKVNWRKDFEITRAAWALP